MLRLDPLNAKQDALELCLKRRESLLRELFRATLAFRKTKSRDAVNYSEDAFLERNNYLEGQSFNVTTLPSLALSPTDNSNEFQLSELCSTSDGSQIAGKDALPRTEELPFSPENIAGNERGTLDEPGSAVNVVPALKSLPTELEGGRKSGTSNYDISVTKGLKEGQDVRYTIAEQFSRSDPSIDSNAAIKAPASPQASQSPSEREVGIEPSATLPTSSDVGNLPQPLVETIMAEQSPGTARTVQLSPKQIQENRNQDDVENSRRLDPVSASLRTNEPGSKGKEGQSDSSNAPSRVDVALAQDVSGSIENGQVEPDGVLQSQMDIVRADAAYVGTPATPDEQLRLEEAQALQFSRIPSSLPEGFEGSAKISMETPTTAILSLDKNDQGQATDVSSSVAAANGQDKVSDEVCSSVQAIEAFTPGIRESAFPGTAGVLSRDLTLTRRPPMRIDTTVPSTADSFKSMPGRSTTTPGATPFSPLESTTSNKTAATLSQVSSPPERMTTRVSSGALRHKSVSEILGETPRCSATQGDRASNEKAVLDTPREESLMHTPRSTISITSPDTAAFKQRLNELKEKERSKLSTVVFARQQNTAVQRTGDRYQDQQDDADERRSAPLDYLLPWFTAQAAIPATSQPLHSLVVSAHKTLTTADHHIDSQEQQDCRILTRIYQLQSANRWSLRQNERSVEPARPKSHWDVLLSQMKWMRTDFREERKWKLAAAKDVAATCALWVASSSEERSYLQVKPRPMRRRQGSDSTIEQPPDLVPSADDESDSTDFEASDLEVAKLGAPASIFSLPPDMFVFGLDKTAVAEKILSELPLYKPSVQIQDVVLGRTIDIPEDGWKTSIVPVSKFVEGKMVMREQGPPRKRSRYDYPSDQEDMALLLDQQSLEADQDADMPRPEKDDVALFRPENKHIRDRIHAGHAFRPPSEFLMPLQSFFESRQSSQWTQAEDDELRRLVREYAYNWSLISSCLSSPSLFSSGAERRTPWECFERWISLEGLPGEMSKTAYFKAYHSRLQAAQRNYEAHQQQLQQHQVNNGQVPLRRRTTLPYLVERRKNSKHLHLVDAMRKLAKKRETALHKQQHVAGLAAMRKQNEAVQPRAAMHTPQEFSRVKFEREQKVQENARLYQQQIIQQREKVRNQRPGGPGNGQTMIPRGPNYPSAANGSSPSVASGLPNGHGQAGPMNQMRPVPPIARLPNGTQVPSSLPSNSQGAPHAPMQPQMQMPPRVPAQMMSDNARIFQEATRLQEQQRRYLAAQTQHQHPPSNGQSGTSASSPNVTQLNGLTQNNAAIQSNASIYGGGVQGRSSSPSVNGAPSGSTSSPRMTNPSQPQPLSSGMVPMINQMQNQIKVRNPQASPEQVKAMTTESLHQYRMNQAAMQAAAGNPNTTGLPAHNSLNGLPAQSQQPAMMNGTNGSPMMNSARAQYAAMVHSQQAQQSRSSGSGGMNAPRPASRSATPQNHPGHAPSQSPRPSQAQMASGQ